MEAMKDYRFAVLVLANAMKHIKIDSLSEEEKLAVNGVMGSSALSANLFLDDDRLEAARAAGAAQVSAMLLSRGENRAATLAALVAMKDFPTLLIPTLRILRTKRFWAKLGIWEISSETYTKLVNKEPGRSMMVVLEEDLALAAMLGLADKRTRVVLDVVHSQYKITEQGLEFLKRYESEA